MKILVVPPSCKAARLSPPEALESLQVFPLWKRMLDVCCCLAALPIFLLCTLLVALLTKATSPGPIFFRQERVGYRGRPFMLYKFRTMHVTADPSTHQRYFAQLMKSGVPMQKLDGKGDSRLIPGGRLLRATGLDELPQIINILRGEMSAVGPRPCIPYEFSQYTAAQKVRFEAAPGLTGLWQVSGKNRTTFEEMIQLDIQYAETRSPRLDFNIIVRTFPALWRQVAESRITGPSRLPAKNVVPL